jgi:prepilin signal peptidase PulO-like enzyme (type II secretory pathway)
MARLAGWSGAISMARCATAAASFVCYLVVMLISYYFGQKYYPITYDLKSIGLYFIVAMGLFAISYISPAGGWLMYLQNTILLILYLLLIVKRDLPLSAIPVVNRFFKNSP